MLCVFLKSKGALPFDTRRMQQSLSSLPLSRLNGKFNVILPFPFIRIYLRLHSFLLIVLSQVNDVLTATGFYRSSRRFNVNNSTLYLLSHISRNTLITLRYNFNNKILPSFQSNYRISLPKVVPCDPNLNPFTLYTLYIPYDITDLIVAFFLEYFFHIIHT